MSYPPEGVTVETGPEAEVNPSSGFGRKISETPCLRKSLLYGIGGGVGAGLACFLFTSNARKSSNFGFFTYIFGTIGTWTYCRYKWSETRMKERQMQYILTNKVLTDGTELQKGLEKSDDA